jgi:hypothetical protein
VPPPAEIAYREAVRSLEGQARDLENIRSHVSITLSAGGIAAAFLGALTKAHGPAFWVAVAAFGLAAVATIIAYWPVTFAWDFDGYELVSNYVDRKPPATEDFVMRELAVHAADDYGENRQRLNRLFTLQSFALLAFGVEVGALLINLAVR